MVNKSHAPGFILALVLAAFSFFAVKLPALNALGISPLIFGVILGIVLGNLFSKQISPSFKPGLIFSAKKILRFAVVLYGFNITFQDIDSVGLDGLMVSSFMLVSTFVLGSFLGVKLFKLDQETSLLIASGSSVCGVAAVLATESTLNSKPHKTIIAIATVVLFGTISMFLYPLLYKSGWIDLNISDYGLFIGGSVHEVAQVVAAADAIDPSSTNTAVIVKMTRVMMLVPLLVAIALIVRSQKDGGKQASRLSSIPWFAIFFILTAAFNSLNILPKNIVDWIQKLDIFLLTMAMTALGLETHFSKFKQAGLRPILLAFVLFIWLLFGGYGFIKIIN